MFCNLLSVCIASTNTNQLFFLGKGIQADNFYLNHKEESIKIVIAVQRYKYNAAFWATERNKRQYTL